MYDKDIRARARLHYKTHDVGLKEVAQHFKIQYRTLLNWSKKEKWQRAKALKDVFENEIKKDLVKKEFATVIDSVGNKIKEKLASNLGESLYDVDEIVRKNTLDLVSDEILLKAMGINFLQKNMVLASLLAKDELLRMLSLRQGHKGDPMLIACAEKYVGILQSIQKSFYPEKDSFLKLNSLNNESINLENLSENELIELLNKENKGE